MTTEEPLLIDLNVRDEFNIAGTLGQCYQCGTCTATCPLNQLNPNKISIRKLFHQAQLGVSPDTLVWNCSSCKLCETRCPRDVEIVQNLQYIRKYSHKRREAPPEFEALLWNILEEANPNGEPKGKRGVWAEGLDLKIANGNDYLLYVGGPESYDPRLQKVAKNMSSIMKATNVDFGILGKSEPDSGEVVREMGDYAYLDFLIENNIKQFNETGVNKIVVLSPHSYDLMKHIYAQEGLDAQVMHYTEFLEELWTNDKLNIKTKDNTSVTYHDPCFLGRYNGIYDEPRNLLEGLGFELLEMAENRSNAICCGGGGNQMYRDSGDGERLSDYRVKQAQETTGNFLVTSCGYCVQNFEDSTKVVGSDMKVFDLIELVEKGVRGA